MVAGKVAAKLHFLSCNRCHVTVGCNSRSRVNKALVNRQVNKKSCVSKLGVSNEVSTETHILEPVRKVWCAGKCAAKLHFLEVDADCKCGVEAGTQRGGTQASTHAIRYF